MTAALAATLLAGAVPAAAVGSPGMTVSAVAQGTTGSYTFTPNLLVLRATAQMVESDISVALQGTTMVVTETEGGPSLVLEPPSDSRVQCTSNNPSGPSSEVRCTFTGSAAADPFGVMGDFATAPRGVTFGNESASPVRYLVVGSAFDDFFEGGPLSDLMSGEGGEDFLLGGGGDDYLFGGDRDDVLYGDDDEDGSTGGNDILFGGPGNDYLEGGPGVDQLTGGAGEDDLDAKDGIADELVDCNDEENRDAGPNEVTFDARLDKPIDCGGFEVPNPRERTMLNRLSQIEVGTELIGYPTRWFGTKPMTFAYRWEACKLDTELGIKRCTTRAQGELTAAGKDDRTGNQPTYTVTRADRGFMLRFVAIADNSKARGGARVESESGLTNVVDPPLTYTIPADFLPTRRQSAWDLAAATRVIPGLQNSKVGPWLTVVERGWRRSAVPADFRKRIKDGEVFAIYVDGKEVTANSRTIELDRNQRIQVEVRVYSALEDRQTCPASDSDLDALRRAASGGLLTLTEVTSWLDKQKCAWAVTWSPQTGKQPLFTVSDLQLEETDNEEQPVRVRITALQPSPAAQLSMAVGAPPNSVVGQSPDHFSVSVSGSFFAFPSPTTTSFWVNLIGDQVRQGRNVGRMDLYVNGVLRSTQRLFGDYSSIPGTILSEPGMARVVLTTFTDQGVPRGQVFVDVPIRDAASASLGELITMDGRCFTPSGSLTPDCSGRGAHPNVEAMRRILVQSGAPQLSTMPAVSALRFASERMNTRFTPIVVNGQIPTTAQARERQAQPRDVSCAWYDLACVVGSAVSRVVNAIIKPTSTPPRAPGLLSIPAASLVLFLQPRAGVGAVTSGKVALVPGTGAVSLDGASLISDQGGSVISDQGGSVISDQGGSLIGLDGATLIGLDGATLIGLDGATLIGLDGATLNRQVALPLIGTLQ